MKKTKGRIAVFITAGIVVVAGAVLQFMLFGNKEEEGPMVHEIPVQRICDKFRRDKVSKNFMAQCDNTGGSADAYGCCNRVQPVGPGCAQTDKRA
ncbi:MAG: hypothetical protein WC554_13530 [Clostridia bacterium]|nr:hypothetical protein [Clostridia bacterium]